MSKLSIYESGWIDFVFADRNKNYGAYKLRQESTKNTVSAFVLAVTILATIGSIILTYNKLSPNIKVPTTIPEFVVRPINLNKITPVTTKKHAAKTKLPIAKPSVVTLIRSHQMTNPVIVSANAATPEVPKNEEFSVPSGTASNDKFLSGNESTETQGVTSETESSNTNIMTASMLDKAPEFPGGMKNFYSYVGNNFTKPEIEGYATMNIIISFIIEKDGSISAIQVVKDPGYGLGKEATRVLKSLKTRWTPGILHGKPVRTAYTLPITIKAE